MARDQLPAARTALELDDADALREWTDFTWPERGTRGRYATWLAALVEEFGADAVAACHFEPPPAWTYGAWRSRVTRLERDLLAGRRPVVPE